MWGILRTHRTLLTLSSLCERWEMTRSTRRCIATVHEELPYQDATLIIGYRSLLHCKTTLPKADFVWYSLMTCMLHQFSLPNHNGAIVAGSFLNQARSVKEKGKKSVGIFSILASLIRTYCLHSNIPFSLFSFISVSIRYSTVPYVQSYLPRYPLSFMPLFNSQHLGAVLLPFPARIIDARKERCRCRCSAAQLSGNSTEQQYFVVAAAAAVVVRQTYLVRARGTPSMPCHPHGGMLIFVTVQ